MKNVKFGLVLLACTIGTISCKDDSAVKLTDEAILGTWLITKSQGAEWEKSEGAITTSPKADDTETLGYSLVISESAINVTDTNGELEDSFDYNFDDEAGTITMNDEEFKISKSGNTMKWSQDDPTENEFEENNSGQLVYFQKFWTLTKQKVQ